MKLLFLSLLLGLSSAGFAEEFEKSDSYVLCKHGKLVRSLRINYKDKISGQCETLYTKGGKDQVVGRGRSTAGCMLSLNSVRGNLEKGFWKCADKKKVKVFVSRERANSGTGTEESSFDD